MGPRGRDPERRPCGARQGWSQVCTAMPHLSWAYVALVSNKSPDAHPGENSPLKVNKPVLRSQETEHDTLTSSLERSGQSQGWGGVGLGYSEGS